MTGTVPQRPEIVLVVAVAENGIIGQRNEIPWRLKADLQRFKAITIGKPIVMGRKTFDSLRRPLSGRTNIVITRDPGFTAAGALVTRSLADALAIAKGDALRRSVTEIAVIGGAEIYNASMPVADRLEVTEVHATVDGDTVFPPIDLLIWHEIARCRNKAAAGDTADHSYVTYRRRTQH
ncbi:dihydrofolate reductase region [Nitrobacter sp. Nb-311A]|uniref:dihydrofolate reductase n=1 Tax=unclassified Nitrobacter TaxID=2620411 RepID=UPI0000687ADB|nr:MULTISPECIES: dihydrofolate reductase [unclassified Nitrobacter]EAQ36457.1 dihydrofolate reductase region [Nitrobacter sp. Nb-311A]MCB1393807.1 dihydrofolate reductase [Nitrobacter sp.]MCV0386533.1 dihydrofolate reductase [Nitrobacter sp.]